MKKNIILTIMAFMIVIAFSCNNSSPKADTMDVPVMETAHIFYTCPMHPEVHSHEPGICPTCGMDLVKKEMAETDSDQIQPSMDEM